MRIYKIKSNVNLAELENYGYHEGEFQDVECYMQLHLPYDVYVNKANRSIIVMQRVFGTHPSDDSERLVMTFLDNYIDDLIRANLVETVEVE